MEGNLFRLIDEIHQLIHEQKLPLRGSSSLGRFSRGEQLLLAKLVLGKMHLTTNQLILVSEWLGDLKRIKKSSLEALLHEKPLADLLQQDQMEARQKGERFFELARQLRYPKLSEAKKKFQNLDG